MKNVESVKKPDSTHRTIVERMIGALKVCFEDSWLQRNQENVQLYAFMSDNRSEQALHCINPLLREAFPICDQRNWTVLMTYLHREAADFLHSLPTLFHSQHF